MEYEPYSPPSRSGDDYYCPPEEVDYDDKLEYYWAAIYYQADWVDVKPYSHNIISITLRIVDEEHGREEANKIIEKAGLESLGWRKMDIEEK